MNTSQIQCSVEARYLLTVFISVVTGATDGVGKAYAEAVRILHVRLLKFL
jgi:hypothetical protein